MGLSNIREFMHAHCRFRLRSGREVFGVVWEGGPEPGKHLQFCTIGEYERSRRESGQLPQAIPMSAEEILHAERLKG